MRLAAATCLCTLLASAPAAFADEIALRIPKPTLGVAASIGQTFNEGQRDAETMTLEGRLSFGRLELAGEVAKSEYDDGTRVDRRIGGNLYLHLGTGTLRPLLSAGGGLLRAEMGGGLELDMAYGQVGAGLLRALGEQVDLSIEAVLGRRTTIRSNDAVLPLAYYRYWPEKEDYGQVSLKLIVRL